MTAGWLRQDRIDLAVERILDAAEVEFAERGVGRATMAAIAERSGCSRATLYTYFANRHELRMAVVNRAAVRIADQVAAGTDHIVDPEEKLVEAVLSSVAAVRATPSLAFWFEPSELAYVHEVAQSSEVIGAIVTRFADTVTDDREGATLFVRWVLRLIVSLLTMPGRDDGEERALVERFLVPARESMITPSRTQEHP